MLVRMLVDTVSRAATCSSTSGRTRGELEPRAVQRLRGVGEWLRLHERSVRGCTASDRTRLPTAATRRTVTGSTCTSSTGFKHVHLEGLAGRYAQLLNDASEIVTRVIDPDQRAQNTTMGGIPESTP